jgi:hypothetical protein
MLGKIDQAKGYFKIILEKRPGTEIDTLEYPPNITVIFRQVKLEQEIAAFNFVKSKKAEVIEMRKKSVLPYILLSTAITSVGVGGYFYYSGTVLEKKYSAINTPDQAMIDNSYNKFRIEYIKSAAFSGISAVLLSTSIYFFMRTNPLPERLSVIQINGSFLLAFSF